MAVNESFDVFLFDRLETGFITQYQNPWSLIIVATGRLYVHSPDKGPKRKRKISNIILCFRLTSYVSDWLHMLVCVNTMYVL